MPKVPTLYEVEAELCRRSFYYFVQYFWDTIIAERPVWNWHLEYICAELQKEGIRVKDRRKKDYDYLIINVPPGSSKSTICSEMYVLWCWTIDASIRFICGSYAATPAEDIAGKCFKIYNSEKYARLFPHLVAKASGGKTHFQNGLLGERYTTSTGSAITGIHAHIRIMDDAMNPTIASSDAERATANKFTTETLSTRSVDEDISITILVMQRLNENDTTGYILNLRQAGVRVKHICLPVEISEKIRPIPEDVAVNYVDGLLDPKRKSREVLATKKAELGSYGYSGQMLQSPSPPEGGILKKPWFPIVPRASVPEGLIVHFQLDTAYTEKQQNDPSGITAYCTDGNFAYILWSTSVKKEFPALCEWVKIFVQQHGYSDRSKIYIEPKASGISVVQQLKHTTKLNVIEDESPDKSKLARVNAASPKCEAGRVVFVNGPWNDDTLNQYTHFPNGAHDEEVDNLSAIVARELSQPKNPFAMW